MALTPATAGTDERRQAADARTTGQSRSVTEGRSVLPEVVSAEEWQKTGRDVEHLRWDLSVLDLTALGRQQVGEDWPPGWPQIRAVSWWRVHDEYEPPMEPAAS